MPRLRPETEKQRIQSLIKLHSKKGFNQTRTAEELGITQSALNRRLNRPPVQKALEDQIAKAAKKAGINITWLLKKYKTGADTAGKVIGYLHQYKKTENGKIEKAEPEEVVSNEFIDTPDWNVQRLYLRDIAEIMKWIKSNGNGKDTGQSRELKIFIVNNVKDIHSSKKRQDRDGNTIKRQAGEMLRQ